MGSCNTTRNEKGGKDVLLKVCEEITGTVAAGTTATATAHGLAVNDLVRFNATMLGTVTGVTAGTLYYVKSVPTTGTFTLSASPGGTVITFVGGSSGTIELFKTVGGLRTKSFSFASEGIEVTNHGSNEWREILDDAGIKSVSLSGEGVYTSATNYRALEASAFGNDLTCLAMVDVVGGRVYVGCYKITGIEASAEFDGEAGYSITAESSGEIAIQQAS